MPRTSPSEALFDARPPWLPKRAAATPDALALEWPGGRLSYAELDARAAATAVALAERGARAGQRIAVRMPGGAAFAVLAHALQRLGVALVPLNLRLSEAERTYQLEDCGAPLLIEAVEFAAFDDSGSAPEPGASGSPETRPPRAVAPARAQPASSADPPPRRLTVRVRDGAWLEFQAAAPSALASQSEASAPENPSPSASLPPVPSNPAPDLDPESPLALLYTSGTTGRPKAALLSHRAFAASAAGHAALLGLDARDRWLACMPLFHVGGLSILWRSALAGSAVVLQERFDAQRVASALDDDAITLVSLVPTMLARLLDAWGARPAPRSLRCALIGGASASEALLERARSAGFPIAPTYGMTEAASQVATRLPGDLAAPQAARLQPLPGTELRIEDDQGRVLGPDQVGTIALRGPTLMNGYATQSGSASAGLDAQGWFRSGDVGVLDREGRLQVLDRRRDLIVSGGENVYPAEIEAVLQDHPALLDAAVSGIADDEYGVRPVAWIVPRPGREVPQARELREWCAQRLARFKLPVAFHVVREVPRNAAGKIARARLGNDADR